MKIIQLTMVVGIHGSLIPRPHLHFRARAAKEADKHKGGKSQLGARAAGNQVRHRIDLIRIFWFNSYTKFQSHSPPISTP
jgi:hypothetical protein